MGLENSLYSHPPACLLSEVEVLRKSLPGGSECQVFLFCFGVVGCFDFFFFLSMSPEGCGF